MKSKAEFEIVLEKCQEYLPLHISMYEWINILQNDSMGLRISKSNKYQTDTFLHFSFNKPISKLLSEKNIKK